MQHPQDLERWRRLSPAERLRIALDLTDLAWQFLMRLPAEKRERRLAIAREPWNPPPPPEPPR